MDFEWLFRDNIFKEKITVEDDINDSYYGVGELICDVFLITQLKALHYQFKNPTYENKEYKDLIKRLYTSNRHFLTMLHNIKSDLIEISNRYHELVRLEWHRDKELENLLIPYLARMKHLVEDHTKVDAEGSEVHELTKYLCRQPRYRKLHAYINELEQLLINYKQESHPIEASKLGRRLLTQLGKLPDKAGKPYKKSREFYTYLRKFQRFIKNYPELDTSYMIKSGQDPAVLSSLTHTLTDSIISFAEDMQHVVCSPAIYNESTFRDLIKTMREYINDKSYFLKDYGDDGGRCFALMEVYSATGYHEIFTLSGVWDSSDSGIETFFGKYGRNQNLINASRQLQQVLGNIEWAVTSDAVRNYMLDHHLEMQCVGSLSDKRFSYPSESIENDSELALVRRDFACCERKMLAYMEARPRDYSGIYQCNLFVKYKPCEKCQYALREFKNGMLKKKEDFYLEYIRTGELEE